MRLLSFLSIAGVALTSLPLSVEAKVYGIDVSHYQANVDFNSVKAKGVEFVYIKATEGTTYKDPTFSSKYSAATSAGLIRGAYHFAQPGSSSGAAQATYFFNNGGGWSGDGRTLPGALDIEAGCYGLSQAAMISWIKDFSSTYAAKAGRPPVIYTTTSWWTTCTGNTAQIGASATGNPLWIARWSSAIGTLPAGWSYSTFWQFADSGSLGPGDQDQFLGDSAALKRFATG